MARVIDQVLGATTSSVVGEITRELVNASDGAGLHFDGAGNISFTPVDLGTKFSFEFVVKADSLSGAANANYLAAFQGGANAILGHDNGTLKFYSVGAWYDFGVNPLNDLKVHHLTMTVNGTSATIFDNANQIATATIATSNIDSATTAGLGANAAGTSGFFDGTIYRARFYNRTLSADDVRTAYQRADVPVADQYGEQNLVDADASVFTSGTYSWVAYGSNTIANVSNDLTISYGGNSSGAYNYLRDSFDLKQDLVIGENYRLRMRAKYAGGASGVTIQVYDGASIIVADSALTTSFVDYEIEFTAQSITDRPFVFFTDLKSGNVVTIDTWQVDQVGCVSDYDLAFANENQSRMVADRSTNNVDGEMSSSGVKQTQVIKQLNSTAMRVGGTSATPLTPADGELMVDSVDVRNGNVRVIGGNQVQLLNAANDTNVDIINSGGTGVAQLGLRVAASEKVTIDTSGNVNVNGGGYVKIAPADTQAELRLYRDDATINTSGIAIGDINFGGADADNDNAARLRVKSDGAWTGSSSPTAFEFQTCPSGSESPQTRLVIGSTGDVTVNESVAIGTSPTAGISLNVRENSTTTAADIRNANASGFGLYVAGGSSSSQYAFRAANKDNTALFTVKGDGLAEFANDVAYDDNARVYHGNLPSTGPSHSSHDKFNFNFTFSGTYGVALITLDIAAGLGEVAAGRYTLAVSCTANSGVTTQLMGSVTEVFKHNLTALTFADSGSSNRTFTLSVERTVTAENWGTNTGSYKLEVTNNHRTLTLNSVTAST